MDLGNFSVSLAVKDIQASKAFYEKFGFSEFGGDAAQGWLILQNGAATIGLFQGMFERNILTFNPGWDAKGQKLDAFTDVRDLQRELRAQGVEFQAEADEAHPDRPASSPWTRMATRSWSTSTSDPSDDDRSDHGPTIP